MTKGAIEEVMSVCTLFINIKESKEYFDVGSDTENQVHTHVDFNAFVQCKQPLDAAAKSRIISMSQACNTKARWSGVILQHTQSQLSDEPRPGFDWFSWIPGSSQKEHCRGY